MSVSKVETSEEFNNIISSTSGPVVVDFFATWCNPCKILGAELPKIASKYPDAKFIKVDADDLDEIAEKYDVSSLPTIVVIKGGEVSGTFIGAKLSLFEEFIAKHL